MVVFLRVFDIFLEVLDLWGPQKSRNAFLGGKKAPAAATTGRQKLGFLTNVFFGGKKTPAAATTGPKKLFWIPGTGFRIPGTGFPDTKTRVHFSKWFADQNLRARARAHMGPGPMVSDGKRIKTHKILWKTHKNA